MHSLIVATWQRPACGNATRHSNHVHTLTPSAIADATRVNGRGADSETGLTNDWAQTWKGEKDQRRNREVEPHK